MADVFCDAPCDGGLWFAPITAVGAIATPTVLATVPAARTQQSVRGLDSEPLSASRTLVVWQVEDIRKDTVRLLTVSASGRVLRSESFAGYLGDFHGGGPAVTSVGDDGALVCWTSWSASGLEVHVGSVSPSGAVRVAVADEPSSSRSGWCTVAASHGRGVVAWGGVHA